MLNILVASKQTNKNSVKHTKKIVSMLKKENNEFSVYFSRTNDDLANNTRALVDMGESEFVIVGDDASINTFINSVKDISRVKLGIVPISKHNNLAKTLGLSHSPIQAVRDILSGNVTQIDYLNVNNTKAVNSVIIGASAEMFEIYSEYKFKNALTKGFLNAKYGDKFEGVELTFDIKNKKTTENVFELCLANSTYSNQHKVSPLSNISDGLINFNYRTVLEKKERKKYIRLFKTGKHIYDEQTHQQWINAIKITSPANTIKALVDGKIMTAESFNVSVVEKGIKLMK